MSQDTRKDPRAKVLTMTVRYKSATLDEFIEHHSYDVSRGGMFIKTPSPFPPGTLLKGAHAGPTRLNPNPRDAQHLE